LFVPLHSIRHVLVAEFGRHPLAGSVIIIGN